ncbi:LacI family DNA-binding transcriptional regulator [Paenibacillus arenilitoris]|uniref:LacI family DNA-binding transcriptional regulator n=1 Tax=Paenibacillus arenilitoris TaxID=2772299 RepID=A0A927CRS6_9BACL|nr:LacI family DNA-binding transcriptional regulator [Paenibacillus arenilitoris]MBD2871673.1 LacI family DNA-binding transcriptional regulator [Paenibacillus arenilitoris]
MDGKKITLKDIAQATGLSVNTVSRALKDKEDIAEATRKMIQGVAKEMGYVGNSLAGSLRSGLTRTIAVIVGDVANPHFAIMVKDIEKAARKHNYTIIVLNTEEDNELEERAIYTAIGKNVDGIIICPAQHSPDNIRFIQRNGVPFVLLGRRFEGETDFDYVISDDFNGGYLATRHLLENGHEKILLLNGPSRISSARERLAGYKHALKERGIPVVSKLITENGVLTGDARKTVKDLAAEDAGFTAIFAFNDVFAWEAIYMLRKMGHRVPEDYAVIGFDNIQSRNFFPFSLSSISNSKSKMSRRALDILLNKINNPKSGNRYHETVETRLILRESTRSHA